MFKSADYTQKVAVKDFYWNLGEDLFLVLYDSGKLSLFSSEEPQCKMEFEH